MPLFYFKCPQCNCQSRSLLPPEKVEIARFCGVCGALLERDFRGSSSQVKEVVDNGLMSRRVEITKK